MWTRGQFSFFASPIVLKRKLHIWIRREVGVLVMAFWGMGGNALLFPPRGATDDFVPVFKTCRLHVMLRCCGYLTLPGQTSLPPLPNQCHGTHGDPLLSGSTRNISLLLGLFTAGAAQKFMQIQLPAFLQRQLWTIVIRTQIDTHWDIWIWSWRIYAVAVYRLPTLQINRIF